MRFHRLRVLGFACAASATIAISALAALADSAAAGSRYPQGLWTGIVYPDNSSQFTFRVKGDRITAFVDRAVGCNAYPNGYQIQTITFPVGAAISAGGSFRIVRHVLGATDTLTGSFRGGSASGLLTQIGVCDTGAQHWVARPGKTPPKPPKPRLAACTPAACQATDKLIFHITGVDRTLTSVQDPNAGPYVNTVDPALTATGGGVLVTFTVSNPTGNAISLATPNEFTLVDAAGGYTTAVNEDGMDLVTQDGAIATNSNTCLSELVTVPPKETSGPVTLCFPVPASARHSMTIDFDYPQTSAKIPLQ